MLPAAPTQAGPGPCAAGLARGRTSPPATKQLGRVMDDKMQKAQQLLAEPGRNQRAAHAPAHRTTKGGQTSETPPRPAPAPALDHVLPSPQGRTSSPLRGASEGACYLPSLPAAAGAPVKPPLNLLSGLWSISIGEQGQELRGWGGGVEGERASHSFQVFSPDPRLSSGTQGGATGRERVSVPGGRADQPPGQPPDSRGSITSVHVAQPLPPPAPRLWGDADESTVRPARLPP